MTHRFDPVSAVLAVVAISGGAAVSFGVTDPFREADGGIWLAGVALAIGFALIPWGRRSDPDDFEDLRAEVEDSGEEVGGRPGGADGAEEFVGSDLVDLDT